MARVNPRSFTDSFIRGYSFVDEIKARNRQEKMLKERLAAQKKQQAIENRRADERLGIAQRAEQRQVDTLERERARVQRERAAREAIALGEDPAEYADTEFGAAELIRQGRENELVSAASVLQDIGRAQTGGGLSSQAPGVVTPGAQPGQPAATAEPIVGESQLGGNRGTGGLDFVEESEINTFDPEYQDLGISGKVGEFLTQWPDAKNLVGGVLNARASTGVIPMAAAGAEALGLDVPESVRGITEPVPGARVGEGITGKRAVPGEFTTTAEFAQMEDPAAIEAARERNTQIVTSLKAQSQRPEANRTTRVLEGSRKNVLEAEAAEAAVTERYSNALDGQSESAWRELAAEEPDAAFTQYVQDRATLQDANPNMVEAMDRQLQPVISEYRNQIQQEIASAEVNSPEHRRHLQRLANVDATAAEIYGDYKPARAAGINQRGLPVGNQKLAGDVVQEIDNPDRPRPAEPQPSNSLRAAGTTVGRVKENTRLNETQIRSVVKLVDAGLMTSADAQTLFLTGKLPQSSLGVKFQSHDPTKDMWAVDANGNYKLVYQGRAKPGSGPTVEPNQITSDMLKDMELGVRAVIPNATPEQLAVVNDLLLRDQDNLSKRFDFRNQQSTITLGRILAQSVYLNALDEQRRASNWIPFDEGDAPTPQELMSNPQLMGQMATSHEVAIVGLPEMRATGVPENFNVGNARAFLQSGDWGPEAALAAEEGSDQMVYETLRRLALLEEYFATQGQ